jgi:hypothetical protein
MTTHAPPSLGWLPAQIRLQRQKSSVTWMDFGTARLSEPFFDHTILRLAAATPPARTREADLDSIVRAADSEPAAKPKGFIFHISRCGSTLIANSLKLARSAVVISEAQTISTLLMPCEFMPWASAANQPWSRAALLHCLLQLFGHRRTEDERHFFVKFTSWNILFLPLVRELWPDVPCLIVVRTPLEVLVSNLSAFSGWMRFKSSAALCSRLLPWPADTIAAMSNEEYGARVIGEFCKSAASAIDGQCRVVDYENLSPGRCCSIANYFGIFLTRSEKTAIGEATRFYSKDPRRTFHDDRAQKQLGATNLMREAVQRWALPWYERLRESEAW